MAFRDLTILLLLILTSTTAFSDNEQIKDEIRALTIRIHKLHVERQALLERLGHKSLDDAHSISEEIRGIDTLGICTSHHSVGFPDVPSSWNISEYPKIDASIMLSVHTPKNHLIPPARRHKYNVIDLLVIAVSKETDAVDEEDNYALYLLFWHVPSMDLLLEYRLPGDLVECSASTSIVALAAQDTVFHGNQTLLLQTSSPDKLISLSLHAHTHLYTSTNVTEVSIDLFALPQENASLSSSETCDYLPGVEKAKSEIKDDEEPVQVYTERGSQVKDHSKFSRVIGSFSPRRVYLTTNVANTEIQIRNDSLDQVTSFSTKEPITAISKILNRRFFLATTKRLILLRIYKNKEGNYELAQAANCSYDDLTIRPKAHKRNQGNDTMADTRHHAGDKGTFSQFNGGELQLVINKAAPHAILVVSGGANETEKGIVAEILLAGNKGGFRACLVRKFGYLDLPFKNLTQSIWVWDRMVIVSGADTVHTFNVSSFGAPLSPKQRKHQHRRYDPMPRNISRLSTREYPKSNVHVHVANPYQSRVYVGLIVVPEENIEDRNTTVRFFEARNTFNRGGLDFSMFSKVPIFVVVLLLVVLFQLCRGTNNDVGPRLGGMPYIQKSNQRGVDREKSNYLLRKLRMASNDPDIARKLMDSEY